MTLIIQMLIWIALKLVMINRPMGLRGCVESGKGGAAYNTSNKQVEEGSDDDDDSMCILDEMDCSAIDNSYADMDGFEIIDD